MLDEIKNKIKNKQLILFGEIHGTKEIPELLSKFFSDMAKEEDFDIFLEIPEEFQNNIKEFFINNKKDSDGKNSLEYFNLIKNLKILNERYNRKIRIFCIDMNSNYPIYDKKNIQNIREKVIAENLLKYLANKKAFIILGSIHASKNKIYFQGIDIIPTGKILFEKLNGKMFNINILPLEGTFYNFGIKKLINNYDYYFNKGFDYVLKIKRVTPCSFLNNQKP